MGQSPEEVEKEKEIGNYHRLADVALKTCATILAIIFAYTFSIGKMPEGFFLLVSGLGLLILISILCSIISLILFKKEQLSIIKWLGIISVVLMFIAIFFMLVLLAAALYQKAD